MVAFGLSPAQNTWHPGTYTSQNKHLLAFYTSWSMPSLSLHVQSTWKCKLGCACLSWSPGSNLEFSSRVKFRLGPILKYLNRSISIVLGLIYDSGPAWARTQLGPACQILHPYCKLSICLYTCIQDWIYICTLSDFLQVVWESIGQELSHPCLVAHLGAPLQCVHVSWERLTGLCT